jgi:hypothetical protein
MRAFVSCRLLLSPRPLNARQTFSRRSRRFDAARNGSTLERVLTMTQTPGTPRSTAAARADVTCEAGRPARSSSDSSVTHVFSSARIRAENAANSVASSWLIWPSRACGGPSSRAPDRTKRSWTFSTRRTCSGLRDELCRRACTASIRLNRVRLNVISSNAAASRGDHSASSAWYAGVLVFSTITPNSACRRSRARPVRSSATTVLSNVGALMSDAIAATSTRCASIAAANAPGNRSGPTRFHGGTPPQAPGQAASSGLSCLAMMDELDGLLDIVPFHTLPSSVAVRQQRPALSHV